MFEKCIDREAFTVMDFKRRIGFGLVAGLLLVVCMVPRAVAGQEWHQFGGPERNFMTDCKGLADEWPEDGPRKLWKRELGDGYSTIASDGDTLYTMYRKGETEYTVAIDAATGKTKWEHEQESPTTEVMQQFGPGPHATPLIAGDLVFTIGSNDMLHAFQRKSGKVVWEKDLVAEFKASVPDRGYASSPIAWKDTIIAPVGGEGAQTLVAFKQADGEVLWKSLDHNISLSSPVLIEFGGKPQLVYQTYNGQFGQMENFLLAVNPDNGELLWQSNLDPGGVYLASPLWTGDDKLFISSAYGGGSHVFQLKEEDGKTKAEQVWYGRKLRIHHGNAVRMGDYVYGSSGDFGPAFMACVDMRTGDPEWRERGFSKSTMLLADGKVIVLDEDGNLALTKMTPEGMEVLSQCKITELYSWAAPTLVGTTLYVRDRAHIMALDLSAPSGTN